MHWLCKNGMIIYNFFFLNLKNKKNKCVSLYLIEITITWLKLRVEKNWVQFLEAENVFFQGDFVI